MKIKKTFFFTIVALLTLTCACGVGNINVNPDIHVPYECSRGYRFHRIDELDMCLVEARGGITEIECTQKVLDNIHLCRSNF